MNLPSELKIKILLYCTPEELILLSQNCEDSWKDILNTYQVLSHCTEHLINNIPSISKHAYDFVTNLHKKLHKNKSNFSDVIRLHKILKNPSAYAEMSTNSFTPKPRLLLIGLDLYQFWLGVKIEDRKQNLGLKPVKGQNGTVQFGKYGPCAILEKPFEMVYIFNSRKLIEQNNNLNANLAKIKQIQSCNCLMLVVESFDNEDSESFVEDKNLLKSMLKVMCTGVSMKIGILNVNYSGKSVHPIDIAEKLGLVELAEKWKLDWKTLNVDRSKVCRQNDLSVDKFHFYSDGIDALYECIG